MTKVVDTKILYKSIRCNIVNLVVAYLPSRRTCRPSSRRHALRAGPGRPQRRSTEARRPTACPVGQRLQTVSAPGQSGLYTGPPLLSPTTTNTIRSSSSLFWTLPPYNRTMVTSLFKRPEKIEIIHATLAFLTQINKYAAF